MPTRQQHIDWALKSEAEYDASIGRWNEFGDPVALADAMRWAYGAQINWLDADSPGRAETARIALDEARAALSDWVYV